MGITTTIAGASFTNYVDRAVPYLSSAKGYWLFGTDGASSTPNLVPGASVNLTANGTPTYGAGYVALDYSTDYYSTGLSISGDFTILVVATNTGGDDYYASGNGWQFGKHSSTQGRFQSSFGPVPIGTFNPGASFGFLAGATAGTSGSPFKLYAGNADALALTSGGSLAADNPAGNVTLGPSGQFSAGVGHSLAAAMLFDTEMSQAQLLEIYQYFRFALPKRGITVA